MSELTKTDCEHAWCTEDVQKWVNSIVKVPTKEKLHLLVQASVTAERERIRLNIIDRVRDLMSCTKNDNCQEFGELIYSYIEEWIDEADPNE